MHDSLKSTRIKISPSLPTRCIRNSLSMHVTMLLFHQVNNLLTAGDIRLYAKTYNKYIISEFVNLNC